MAGGRRRSAKNSLPLFKFDTHYWERYEIIAGVDEAGRGPLAGPVVAAAVILPKCQIPYLADSKRLTPERRSQVYRLIQQKAYAIGVGVVPHDEIDRINILQATYLAMRLALDQLMIQPAHVLVDGYPIRACSYPQTGLIDGDAKSASIAAASIIAKVTRDCMMMALDREFPGYGFKRHKGYGTREHLECLRQLGPSTIHRRSFRPVLSPIFNDLHD